ncbi:UNVERIFIED_CONTAM: hypothetical protein HDU68_002610 [Siphonaria sp. JEL0065]|nr:hypothetical protein HDU68_002610 [Siphonaria sp. JEL0065]
MSQLAPPPSTLTSTTLVNDPSLLTKQIPSISKVIGQTCSGADNLIYTCGWDGVHAQEIVVQCQNGQIVFVNSCAANPSLPNSGGACVYYDYGLNGANSNLYLPYCVNLIPAATSKPTESHVYVKGQIVIAPISGTAAQPVATTGGASTSKSGAATATGIVGFFVSVFALLL